MVAALKGNQVDAIIIAPHLAKPLVAAGKAKLLGWYSDFDEYQFGGLFTATATAQNKRDLTQRFVRAYQRGCADYAAALMQRDAKGARVFDASSDAAATEIAKYVYPGDPLDKSVPLVEASAFPADAAGRLDVGDIYKQIAWMKSQGLVDAIGRPEDGARSLLRGRAFQSAEVRRSGAVGAVSFFWKARRSELSIIALLAASRCPRPRYLCTCHHRGMISAALFRT